MSTENTSHIAPTLILVATLVFPGSITAAADWVPSGPDGYLIVDVERHPTDPLTIYAVPNHPYAGIFRTTDGGAAFTPFALAGENVVDLDIPVNDPDVLLAAVEGTGVLISEDRGTSWNPHGTGLVHTYVADILFRPESGILFAGTQGGAVYRFAGAGRIGPDIDLDAVADADDNCVDESNPGQENSDADLLGDACDCAPADPEAYRFPVEITGLRVDMEGAATVLTWDDPRPDPAPGTGIYYLVRAVNSCGAGTFGDGRGELDLSSPCDP